jgi:hypothetical protein
MYRKKGQGKNTIQALSQTALKISSAIKTVPNVSDASHQAGPVVAIYIQTRKCMVLQVLEPFRPTD